MAVEYDYQYNTKIFQYADGAQVRRYKKNIKLLSDSEKEKRRQRRERVFEEMKARQNIIINPFTGRDTALDKDFDEAIKPASEHSIETSINRSKNVIYQLARANKWEYFITLTFNPDKVNSFDYDIVTKELSKWLNHLRKRIAPDICYILIPEKHKSGAFHFHGLMKNCAGLEFVDSGRRTVTDDVIYNIANYALGFTTATKVKDSAKACGYFTKYITKELYCVTKNKKRYWNSKNICRPVVHAYEFSDEQFNDNILDPYDEFLATSSSVAITDGVDEINHVAYYEFADHKV